jgi:hypothetical protein
VARDDLGHVIVVDVIVRLDGRLAIVGIGVFLVGGNHWLRLFSGEHWILTVRSLGAERTACYPGRPWFFRYLLYPAFRASARRSVQIIKAQATTRAGAFGTEIWLAHYVFQ